MTTLPRCYRYYPIDGAAFQPDVVNLALAYPGVRAMKDGSIEAPLNAAWLAERALQSCGVAYKWWTPKVKDGRRPQSIGAVHGLRTVDPLTGINLEDFLTPYQKREPFAFADHEGVLFQWMPGAGKSLGGMIWGLLDDGPIAIVTGAKGRLQWRDQIRRYTTHEPVILTGAEHIGDQDLSLWGPAKCKRDELKKAKDTYQLMAIQPALCSCGLGHRAMIVQKKSDDGWTLYARVRLPVGHHELLLHKIDIEEPGVPAGSKFIVCGWETLPYHIDKILAAKPVTAILDESHRGKNHRRVDMVELTEEQRASEPKAKKLDDGRWVKYVDLENIVSATKTLCHKTKRHGLLTATPVKDRVRDLWAQLDYAIPWGWGKYWDWAKRYCAATKTGFGWDDRGKDNLDELAARVSFIRSYVSAAESHAALPPKRREIVLLSPDVQQHEDEGFAEELEAAAKARASVHSIANIRLAAACSRKRKAICDEVIEAVNGGANVIVFTARRNDVEVMKAILKGKLFRQLDGGRREEAWSYFGHGAESQEDRHEASVAFMRRASHSLFCGTGYSFGEQIDLHNADIMIFAMLPWTIAELIQWEGRAWRLGSLRACLYKYMIAEGTWDERVANILLSKLPAIEKMGTEGIGDLRAALTGNEEELLAALAKEILAGPGSRIEGIAE